jgi:hypothetical protein
MDNLITDMGLNQIGTGGGAAEELYTVCAVGTGTTPPADSDTALVALVASVGNLSRTLAFVEGTPAYWRNVVVYRFSTGVAAGNLSEVGTGNSATALFSRALILDSGGSPTTITVLSDEVLDVTYEVRSYLDKSDQTPVFTISSVAYNVVLRLSQIGSPPLIGRSMNGNGTYGSSQITVWSQTTLGTVYQSVQGGGATSFVVGTFSSYGADNFYVDVSYVFPLGSGNFTGGIGAAVILSNQTQYQMNFDPKIPKAFYNVLTVVFRHSWARYP